MVKDIIDESTGCGISPYITDNEHPIINIYLDDYKLAFNDDFENAWTYDEYIELSTADIEKAYERKLK
jgi:hypothetical protein